MVAAAGTGPCPFTTSTRPCPAGAARIGTSPPGPFRCGSTTWSTNPAATAASKALPPRSSTAIPVAEASQWVEDTMPKGPTQLGSGREHTLSITTEKPAESSPAPYSVAGSAARRRSSWGTNRQ